MDLRKEFAKRLLERIGNKESLEKIGGWSYLFFLDNVREVGPEFGEILLTLNKMEEGPEFAFTYEELEQIANDLIAGKDVKL